MHVHDNDEIDNIPGVDIPTVYAVVTGRNLNMMSAQ